MRATVYRLQLAVAFLLEAAPDPGQWPRGDARPQLAPAVKAVRDRIAMGGRRIWPTDGCTMPWRC